MMWTKNNHVRDKKFFSASFPKWKRVSYFSFLSSFKLLVVDGVDDIVDCYCVAFADICPSIYIYIYLELVEYSFCS